MLTIFVRVYKLLEKVNWIKEMHFQTELPSVLLLDLYSELSLINQVKLPVQKK